MVVQVTGTTIAEESGSLENKYKPQRMWNSLVHYKSYSPESL
jgi:hypothetical protein